MAVSRNPHQNRSNKDEQHVNDLDVWNGAALLVADCMGTGVSKNSVDQVAITVLPYMLY